MKHLIQISLAVILPLGLLCSCEGIRNVFQDKDVVARYGKRRLYRDELDKYIPESVDDETRRTLALQYINIWAMEYLFQDVSEEQLTKEELDVTKELEDYRRSLLKFRYEQRYIGDRLDTLVRRDEIESYYEDNKSRFVLTRPIVKARFLDIMQESPNMEVIKRCMSSDKESEVEKADSLAAISALRYEDKSEEWVDMEVFAKNFGMDYASLLARMRYDGFIEVLAEEGDARIGFVCDIVRQGNIPPVEYCEKRIKDIILSTRKHELLATLEQDLLNDALDKKQLIIY